MINRIKQTVFASLCALCLAQAASATVMTFDGSSSSWDTAYDSATANVVFQSNRYSWGTGYNDLVNVAYGDSGSGSLTIDFIALGGATLSLNSFDLGNYLGNGARTGYVVYDLSNLATPLVSNTGLSIAYSSGSHSSFNIGLSSTAGFRLVLGPDIYNNGVDNINFTTSTASVPEPGTIALAGLALLAGTFARRARKIDPAA